MPLYSEKAVECPHLLISDLSHVHLICVCHPPSICHPHLADTLGFVITPSFLPTLNVLPACPIMPSCLQSPSHTLKLNHAPMSSRLAKPLVYQRQHPSPGQHHH